MTRPHPGSGRTLVYRGHGPGETGGGRLVTIETAAGEVLGQLRHVPRHSPTGMTWGYAGSGPADLARSLLIDAAGTDALCTACGGTGRVVYPHPDVGGEDEPAQSPYDPSVPPWEYEQAGYVVTRCWGGGGCDEGYLVRPATYQRFKFDVVAGLPKQGWTLTRAAVRAWLADHAGMGRG